MAFISLLWEFFKVGLFTYGGGLAMLPLFQHMVVSNGWMSQQMFVDMIAISQSTPGPIAINMATFVGFNRYGVLGAVLASFILVVPGVTFSLLVSIFLNRFKTLTTGIFTLKVIHEVKHLLLSLLIVLIKSLISLGLFFVAS